MVKAVEEWEDEIIRAGGCISARVRVGGMRWQK